MNRSQVLFLLAVSILVMLSLVFSPKRSPQPEQIQDIKAELMSTSSEDSSIDQESMSEKLQVNTFEEDLLEEDFVHLPPPPPTNQRFITQADKDIMEEQDQLMHKQRHISKSLSAPGLASSMRDDAAMSARNAPFPAPRAVQPGGPADVGGWEPPETSEPAPVIVNMGIKDSVKQDTLKE